MPKTLTLPLSFLQQVQAAYDDAMDNSSDATDATSGARVAQFPMTGIDQDGNTVSITGQFPSSVPQADPNAGGQ